ncbi:MAG: acyl-CoA dehydrogenase family protein [Pseudomonadota bacterium]
MNASSEVRIARALGPELTAASLAADAARRADPKLIRRLRESGLLAMVIPERYGGTQRPAPDSLAVLEELAYADSAVAWCAMIYTTTAMLGSFLPEEWARRVFSIERSGEVFNCPVAAGAAAPSGRGRVVEGGVVVSGRWAWGSGTHHAQWICGGTIVEEDGKPRTLPNGAPAVHVMFFEPSQVQLHDNWDPSGLRGTGSVDFEVVEQFVPDGRWTLLGASRRQVDAPLYRFPFFGYFAGAVACVPLGIARRAVDDFADLAQTKRLAPGGPSIASSSVTQLDFGRAEALVQGAHAVLFHAVESVWSQLIDGAKPTLEDRRRLRLAASQATRMSVDAVDILYDAAGGTAVGADCSLQKHFRDIHTATAHRMVSREILRMAGAARLQDETPANL